MTPWEPWVRFAICDWPRSPAVYSALANARRASYITCNSEWPVVVSQMSDSEIAKLLTLWLDSHPVRRAIARYWAKKFKKTSREVLETLNLIRAKAEVELKEEANAEKDSSRTDTGDHPQTSGQAGATSDLGPETPGQTRSGWTPGSDERSEAPGSSTAHACG